MCASGCAKTHNLNPAHAVHAALGLVLLLILLLKGSSSADSATVDDETFGFPVAIVETGSTTGSSIAVDASGSVYITGNFRDTVDFDPGAGTAYLTSAGFADIFIQKLNSDGKFLWVKAITGIGHDRSFGIAVDATGNVYTTGSFQSTADFDPGAGTFSLTSAGPTDMFVCKLDSAGSFVWAKSMGGSLGDFASGIAVDASGNVYITGTLSQARSPAWKAAKMGSGGTDADIFVSKLDSDGNFLWANSMGGVLIDGGRGIAVDAWGNVYIAGAFLHSADFDPGMDAAILTTAGQLDFFVCKLSSRGIFLWAKAMGGPRHDYVYSIAVDAWGNVYTTGSFWTTADFDPGEGVANLTSTGKVDIFVSKLDSHGNFQWAKAMGGTGEDLGLSIALDTSGNVYTTGYFQSRVDFDPGAGRAVLTSAGDLDIFIQKLDSEGNYLWARAMGGANIDKGRGIAVDMSDNVYITGSFVGTVDLHPGRRVANLTSEISHGVFITKFNESELALKTWVDSQFVGSENGSGEMPFNTLPEALSAAPDLGTIRIIGDEGTSVYSATTPIDKAVTLEAENGPIRIERDSSTGTRGPGGDGSKPNTSASGSARMAGGAESSKSVRRVRTGSWKLRPEVFVDFGYKGHELGTKAKPVNTMKEAIQVVMEGGTVWFRGGTTNETFDRLDKPMSLKVWEDESR